VSVTATITGFGTAAWIVLALGIFITVVGIGAPRRMPRGGKV
jgi:hypothetical protein